MIRVTLPFMAKDAAYYFWHPMLTQGTFFAAAAAAAADILNISNSGQATTTNGVDAININYAANQSSNGNESFGYF
jgi:hypothetical protein